MGGLVDNLREPLAAFRNNFRNRDLRRLQLALTGSVVGEWAFSVALAVYAFRHGGATAVGVVALIRTIPSAIASPFAGLVGDRFRRERVMLGADAIRMTLAAAAAALALT